MHKVKIIPEIRCGECNSAMHLEHESMASRYRCDVIVKLPPQYAETIECEQIPHRSPVSERQ